MKDDILGALSCLFLVFFSTFPVLIPFFIIRDLGIAIRVSNLIAIVMLFVIGYEWARYTSKNRFEAGVDMVLIGLIIIGITIALVG